MKRLLILLLPLALSSCIDRVSMQSRYDKQRDHCREDAEKKTGRSVEKEDIQGANVRSPADAARNKELASHFSECMFTQGWTIATPAPVVASAPGKPPVGTPVGGAAGGVVAGSTAAGYGTPGPYANNSTYPGQVVSGPVQAARRPQETTTLPKAPGQGLPGSPAGPSANMPPATYYVPPAGTVTQAAPAKLPAKTVPVTPVARPPAKKAAAPVYPSGSPQAAFDAEFDAAH